MDLEHAQEVSVVARKYNTKINLENLKQSEGLRDDQVVSNREKFGSNLIPEPRKPSLFRAYLSYLQNLFSIMLIICGVMSLVLFIIYSEEFSHLYVGLILILASFFNAFLEFFQKYKSEELLKGFMKLVPDEAYVRRNGYIKKVNASDIVVGDLLLLRLGDKIAADSRVIYASELKVDNSVLTGESEAVERDSQIQESGSAFEARNIVFNGTTVASGEGLAIVIRTGKDSEIGKLSLLNESTEGGESQLSQEMSVAVRLLVTSGLITGSALMIISFAQGFGLAVSIEIAIGSYLAFLPQGLPMTITSLLTVAAKRMASKNVLVKTLQSVETLGAITLLATDKTGTLTMNRMDVIDIWEPGEISAKKIDNDVNLGIIEVCKHCSNVRALEDGRLLGDATEQGIFRMIQSSSREIPSEDASDWERIFEIAFSSSSKWHLVVVKRKTEQMVYMKGAPEKVFSFCKALYDKKSDSLVEIDELFAKRFNEVYADLGNRGLRVIACAGRAVASHEIVTDRENFTYDNLIFYGLIGLQDPPKEGVAESILRLKGAGIRVVMITGDHPLTAEAIARQIGLITAPRDKVLRLLGTEPSSFGDFKAAIIHGEMVDAFTDKEWDKIILADEIVFARTQPKHKLNIVKRFQEYGHLVAVCGDGANDSPALKTADLGISMNKTASDVSKEAADMILLDDNFNTIIVGVAEGRLIFENLKKSIRYTLTHITSEISSLATVAIVGLAFPMSAMLILIFDLFCETGPAMSYATELAPLDFLKLKPRKIPRLQRIDETSTETSSQRFMKTVKSFYHVKIEGEHLFDRELLFWAFCQGGIFIAIGAFSAYILTMIWENVPLSSLWRSVDKYFDTSIGVKVEPLTLTTGAVIDADAQSLILEKAQSAFFLSVIIGQWFNLFLTKHRYRYPHGWDIFRNKSTYLGMFTSGTIASLVVFVPGLQSVFKTSSIVAIAIAPPVTTGILLVLYEYPRRWIYFRMKRNRKKKSRKTVF